MGAQQSRSGDEPGKSEIPGVSQLFDSVLKVTLERNQKSLTDEEWKELRSSLLDSQGSDNSFESIVHRLVLVFLQKRYAGVITKPQVIEQMAESVSKTLCSDPESRSRLLEFQSHLMNYGVQGE